VTWKPKWRQRLRVRHSTRALPGIEGMLIEHLSSVAPSSQLGRALQYMQGQSPKLIHSVETCKANGIESYRYLVGLLEKRPIASTADNYSALMPWSMSTAITP